MSHRRLGSGSSTSSRVLDHASIDYVFHSGRSSCVNAAALCKSRGVWKVLVINILHARSTKVCVTNLELTIRT